MGKDTKFLIGAFFITILLVVGVAFLISRSSSKGTAEIPTTPILGVTASPENYDLGSVPINGGIVTREYEIKNTTDKTIKLVKIATSCMCTTASVAVGGKTTKFFGMEGHTDKNPPLNLDLKAGETAKLIVNFDPAAHGPEGTGEFERIVWLYFAQGVKELSFKGEVVK